MSLEELRLNTDDVESLKIKLAQAEAKIRTYEHQNGYTLPVASGTFALDLDNPLADELVLNCLDKSVLVATIHREHKIRLNLEKQIPELKNRVQQIENKHALVELVKAQQAEITRLKEEIACFEAMKEGVQIRIADLEEEISALKKRIESMLNLDPLP